ncbi:hypothetical protein CLV62_12039 [Dysgonomonas alginatilytica]|uniref:Uncharacterized protein n=2 Tax=Dysgonomonas alginatilytica TaxID=1605892 RepID=A0A2V3PMZ4_9BACT|nr:hypothetical protein CLV62_12039 [Dysgonomonas alginatilytica]
MDELRKLSVLCVSLQYKHHYEGTLDKEIQEQTYILMSDKKSCRHLDNVNLFSTVGCIDYQIELCHLEELRPLTQAENNAWKFLQSFKSDLAKYIVYRLADSDGAVYSID